MNRQEAVTQSTCGGACHERGGEAVSAALARLTCSVDEAAGLLGIGRSTAYAAARDGSLPTIRVSNRILVPVAKLRALLGLEETE